LLAHIEGRALLAETREECRIRQQIKVVTVPMPKQKTPLPAVVIIDGNGEPGAQVGGDNDLLDEGGKRLSRPYSSKVAKEEHKLQKKRKCAIEAQAHATSDMVAASFQKAQVLQDQATLALFTIRRTPTCHNKPNIIYSFAEMRR
jgi:hypothetical protein